MNAECLKGALEDLERAQNLVRKSHVIEDVEPAMIEAFVSPDMWIWSQESEEVFAPKDWSTLTKGDILHFANRITLEALERFADCECAARFMARLPEWAKVRTTESTQAAPRKITDIRVRRP